MGNVVLGPLFLVSLLPISMVQKLTTWKLKSYQQHSSKEGNMLILSWYLWNLLCALFLSKIVKFVENEVEGIQYFLLQKLNRFMKKLSCYAVKDIRNFERKVRNNKQNK